MYQFTDISGHDFIKESLKKVLASGRIAHAYIFDGIEGVGKKLIANTFAKALLCQKEGPEPCDECISCRAFNDGNNPDVIYPKPVKGQALGVDDIREQVNASAGVKPYSHKYKIFILDRACDMTVQAQNALLKTIEEPPAYAIFILISKNYRKFLPTIISRCVLYRLKEADNYSIEKYLESKGFKPQDALGAAALSGGSIGRAIMLLEDENFKSDREEISSILSGLPNSNLWDILLLAKGLEKYKENPDRLLDIMYLWYRVALVYKSTDGKCRLMQKDKTDKINLFCENMSLKKLAAGIDSVIDAKKALRYNGNYLLTMEIMLMKMTGF